MNRAPSAAKGTYTLIGCLLIIAAKVVVDLQQGGSSTNVILVSDLFNQWLPLYQFIGESLDTGELPLWNPYIGVGTPLFAELGLGLFNPMTWPVFFFDAPLAMFISQLSMILLGVVGMWWYLGYLQLHSLAKIPGSLLFGLVIFSNSFLPSGGMSLSVLPIILLTVSQLIDRPCFRTAAIASLVLAICFFSGLPNFFYYTGLLVGSFSLTLCLLLHDKNENHRTLSRFWWLLASVILMLPLVAAQLLPTYELSLLSIRDVTSDLSGSTQSELMQADIGLLVKSFFSADSYNLYSTNHMRLESGLGYLSAMSAFFLLAFLDRKNLKTVIALSISILFMSLFLAADTTNSLGFMRELPLAGTLRWHGRISDYIQVVVIILSTIGLSSFMSTVLGNTSLSTSSEISRYRVYLPPLLVLQLYLVYYCNGYSVALCLVAGVSILAGYLLAFPNQTASWKQLVALVAGILLSVDVLIHRENTLLTPLFAEAENPFQSVTMNDALRSRIEEAKSQDPNGRVLIYKKGFNYNYKTANIGLTYRLPNVNAYTGFTLASWRNYLSAMVGEEKFESAASKTPLTAFNGTLNGSLLRLLRRQDSILAVAAVNQFITEDDSTPIVDTFPRAFLTTDYTVAGDPVEALHHIRKKLGTPGPWVVLENDPGIKAGNDSIPGALESVVYRSNKITFDAELSRPGLLVLNDAYYPGWRAMVNGQSAEILRANSTFRAVVLDEGKHTIEFVYRPLTLYLGILVSLLALIVVMYPICFGRKNT